MSQGIVQRLSGAEVPTYVGLVREAYTYIRPEHDQTREGSFSPDRRDDAEMARNQVLTMLIGLEGEEAYRGMRSLAEDDAIGSRAHRFNELARRMAERDADLPAWTESQVVAFEQERRAPMLTGAQLLDLALDLLQDIQSGLRGGDVSSRAVLELAQDEGPVQQWLGEQFELRGRDYFDVTPEGEVADENRPDLLLTSHASPFQVAVEVKNGRKQWSINALRVALKVQLAESYLKVANRRHGVLVVSNHGPRTWKHPETGASLQFAEMITLLQMEATMIHSNTVGAVVVRVVGIDAASRESSRKRAEPPES